MLSRMFRFELLRLIQRRRLLFLAALGFALLMGGAVTYLGYHTPQETSLEAFSFTTDQILPLLLPLLGGFATGGALAEDGATGLRPLIMSRGVSPRTYILAKALGSVVGQTGFTAGLLAATLLALMPFFPFGPILQFSARYAEDLAATNPLLYCLSVSAIYTSAAVAFSGISLLVSVWVRNGFVVMAAPLVVYIAALYSLDPNSHLVAINPYFRLAVGEAYGPGFTLLGSIVYWILIAVVAYSAAVLAFSLKRDYA